MQIELLEYARDGGTLTMIVLLLGVYRKVSILGYQHKLIWAWFKKEHKIEAKNGD